MTPRSWLAFAVVCVVWGSTYLAIRFMVAGIPPFIGAGTRFLAGGALMAAFVAARGEWRRLRVTRAQLTGCVVIGLLLPAVGNGLVTYAEQDLPSAMAALVIASVPLWVVAFRAASGRPSAASTIGTVGGFVGLAFLLGADTAGVPASASVLAAVAAASWAFGSVVRGRLTLPGDVLVTATYEMLAAGVALVVVGWLAGERTTLLGADAGSVAAWAYLVLVGSVLAYTAYAYLLDTAPVGIAATYAYVNPVVAVALGVGLAGESLAPGAVLGGTLALVGVVVVVRAENRSAVPGRTGAEEPPLPRLPSARSTG